MPAEAPYTDIRLERPSSFDWIGVLPGLVRIDLHPPAAGPEIELTFGTINGVVPLEDDDLRRRIEHLTGRSPLAIRHRPDDPSDGLELEDPGWFARTRLGRRLLGED